MTPKSGISGALAACLVIQVLAVVTGCSEIGFGRQPEKVDPNVYPENYKKDLLAYLKTHPTEMPNAREAAVSTPALKPFGAESRYVACLRASGPDWRKAKMVIFFSGRINQFIDAEGDPCSAAQYQPFPELVAELSQLKGKK
jgi:hypothetical protein